MDIQAQVAGVTVRNTTTGRTVYDVTTSDGAIRSVWDGNLAQRLSQYAGQPHMLTLRVEQRPKRNGQGFWEDIKAFAAPGQALPPEVQVMQPNGPGMGMQPQPMGTGPNYGGGAQVMPVTPQASIQPSPTPAGGGGQWSPETVTRITKLAAIADASTLVAGIMAGIGPEGADEAAALVLKIANGFYHAARSHEQSYDNAPPTPQSVAAGAPGVTVGMPVEADVDMGPEGDESDPGWD